MRRTCLIVARIRKNLSQGQVARKIGVSQQSYAKYEKGTSLPHDFKIISDLENVLDTDRHCLFKDLFDGCKCGDRCNKSCRSDSNGNDS